MPSRETDHTSGEVGLSEVDVLRRMYRITADHERPFEEKLGDLLRLGRAYLDVEAGFLTEISDGTQRIVEADGDHHLLQAGESCPLSKAYCRKTIQQEDTLTVQHAAIEGWEDDTAYETFGLESYIGAKVVVDGDLYGTFCFADSEPRERPFSETEETFVELMAEWVSYELFQKRATERIREQRDRLEEFAGVVSHDLRNPLNVARGFLEMAEETGDPEDFDRSLNALDRMEALIDDLLVLAREGQEISDTGPVPLSEVIEECWSFVATEGATLEIRMDPTVRADGSRLQQLFENLFRNAIEHGGEDVTVRVGTLEDDPGIYVEDDGPGIPAEERSRVFEDGYSTSEDGTGFGLVIVRQVVDAHDWNVDVTESESGGARFEITGVDIVAE
ncbi:GAF domain-containing sensor histidine kinase [Salinirubellus sp. GCM10025818]|uniref:GAF domain-containing sensor histidine kinase n=1 Tax=Salinirubellus TaxID=2162630 RepID=UPI0030D57A75